MNMTLSNQSADKLMDIIRDESGTVKITFESGKNKLEMEVAIYSCEIGYQSNPYELFTPNVKLDIKEFIRVKNET